LGGSVTHMRLLCSNTRAASAHRPVTGLTDHRAAGSHGATVCFGEYQHRPV